MFAIGPEVTLFLDDFRGPVRIPGEDAPFPDLCGNPVATVFDPPSKVACGSRFEPSIPGLIEVLEAPVGVADDCVVCLWRSVCHADHAANLLNYTSCFHERRPERNVQHT